MRMQQLARIGLLLALGGTATACGSSGGSSSSPSSHVGESASVTIKDGQSASLTQGAATLEVPAGALPAGSKVDVAVKDKKTYGGGKDVAIDVYEFEVTPAVPVFAKPVTLSFDITGVTVPKGSEAVVAWWDTKASAWQTLETSLDGTTAKADTTHFTPFTVIFRVLDTKDGGGIAAMQTGGQCGGTFNACGGDLVGTWNFTAGCVDATASDILGNGGSDPFAACTERPSVAITIDLNGTVTFNQNSTFSVHQTVTTDGSVIIPDSCLQQATMGMKTCAGIGGNEKSDGCHMSINKNDGGGPEMKVNDEHGTYSISGSTFSTVTADGDAGVSGGADAGADPYPGEFCVKGNTLTVSKRTGDGKATIIYTATRQ